MHRACRRSRISRSTAPPRLGLGVAWRQPGPAAFLLILLRVWRGRRSTTTKKIQLRGVRPRYSFI
jgi:hypothetical protein